MKTYCKHSRITEPEFVRDCIERFLKGKRSRRDVSDFLRRHHDLDLLSRQIADEIRRGEYSFVPIRYFRRVEPISGKIRIIGRESIRHQIYDYVCGPALMPLFRAKVGRWQTASIPGRGIADARRAIRKWVREPSSKVFVKLDVRKCYPSISREVLKRLLTRDVGDKRLLDLTFHLIDQYKGDDGLNIGSYLSQWLANYYLSYAYHFCEQHLSKERVNRKTGEITTRRLVTHLLFYMDDVLLVGRSKRDLTIAVKRIRAYLHDVLRLEIHPTWNVKHVGMEPIDMVGFTFYLDHTGVRAGIFLRARRSFRRYARNPSSLRLAYRCASYYGWLKNSDSIQYRRRHDVDQIVRHARNTIAAHNRKE